MPFYVRAHLGPIGWSHRIGGRSRHAQRKPAARRQSQPKVVPESQVEYTNPHAEPTKPRPWDRPIRAPRTFSWVLVATKQGEEPIEMPWVEDFYERTELRRALHLRGWRMHSDLRPDTPDAA